MSGDLLVAIDARPLALPTVTGIGLLLRQIVGELGSRGVRFVGLSDRPLPEDRLGPTTPVHVIPGGGGRIRWEETRLAPAISALRPAPDLYHATWNHGLPAGLSLPSVLSLHDLIPWRHPALVPWPRPAWLHRALYRRAVRRSARAATVITTLSEASRSDIGALLPGVADRVRIVPCALPRWFRHAGPEALEATRARYGDGYWLYVGGFDPRKDVPLFLRAAARVFVEHPRARTPIVLVGEQNEHAEACRALAGRLGLTTRWPGYVADEQLAPLYAAATLFVYPSRYEGFGIPPLLALAAGTPCVASDGGSIPEVVGDAGLLFRAGDGAALTRSLLEAVRRPQMLRDRATRGPDRARTFNLERLAEGMIRVYEEAVRARGGSA